jgi:uncharacterized protein YdhG (YjbR/CyaY superfamily)
MVPTGRDPIAGYEILVTMSSKTSRPKSVTEYINAAPKGVQEKLREMRSCIRAVAPGATESLKWGMPAFSYRRILVTFAAHTNHIGFYPTPSAVKAFARRLTDFITADGSIRFPLKKPLPLPLIRQTLSARKQGSYFRLTHRGNAMCAAENSIAY